MRPRFVIYRYLGGGWTLIYKNPEFPQAPGKHNNVQDAIDSLVSDNGFRSFDLEVLP